MIKFSVIIPTYQRIDIVEDCLSSIEKFNDIGDSLEIVISDNSLGTELVDYFSEKFPSVKTVKNKNIGFGGACNRGFEISSGEYVLFLNPDTILVEPVFKFAIECFENEPNLALFGVQLIDKNNNNVFSFGVSDIFNLPSALKNQWRIKRNKFKDKGMFISGADLFVRRSVFEQAGKFDENIFMYLEETDLIRRIKQHCDVKQVAFFNCKRIIHLGGATDESCGDDKALRQAGNYEQSVRYYAEKYGINYEKILRYRIKTTNIRKIIYGLKMDKEQVRLQKLLLTFYKDELRKIKEQNGK